MRGWQPVAVGWLLLLPAFQMQAAAIAASGPAPVAQAGPVSTPHINRRPVQNTALLTAAPGVNRVAVGESATRLREQYYAARRAQNPSRVFALLQALHRVDPDNAWTWRALGYYYQRVSAPRKAAHAFEQAFALGHASNSALAAAYARAKAGERAAAESNFRNAMATGNANAYNSACMGAAYSSFFRRKHLPSPWYGTEYATVGYLSRARFSDVLLHNTTRVGRYINAAKTASAYGYVNVTTDTQSAAGPIPVIYNDNYAAIGLGVGWRPFRGLRLFAQGGREYNLIARNGRRFATNATVGATYFARWGSLGHCRYALQYNDDAFGDFYGSIAYYSRYENTLSQLTLREGLHFANYKMSTLAAYMKLTVHVDSEGVYYNNAVEAGVGLAWHPNLSWPVQIRAELVHGYQFRAPGPQGRNYNQLLVQGIVNFRW